MKTSKKENIVFGIIIFGGLFFIAWLIEDGPKMIDLGFLKSEITAYPISCYQNENNDSECYQLYKKVFKVNTDNQTVVRDWEDLGLTLFEDCVIKNRKNWQCKNYSEYSKRYSPETFGFRNGVYFSDTDNTTYVSNWEYNNTPEI